MKEQAHQQAVQAGAGESWPSNLKKNNKPTL